MPRSRFAGSLLVSGYGQNRNEQSPLIWMPIVGHLSDGVIFARAGFGREIVVEIVVQLDAVEARVLGELQALAQVIRSG
jgi:hypothetical protein